MTDVNIFWLSISLAILLAIVHLSLFVQKALATPANWRRQVLKWGTLFLIPFIAFVVVSPAARGTFSMNSLLGTQQNWNMTMQNVLHQLGLATVVLATVALLRGLIMKENPTSLPATLVVLLVGYVLMANGHWPAVMTAGAVAIALVIRQIFADRTAPAVPVAESATADPKI